MSVDWDEGWQDLRHLLAAEKERAHPRGTRIDHPRLGPLLVYRTGRAPAYSYHVRMPELHLWIADRPAAGAYANVYASLSAKSLWSRGVEGAVQHLADTLRRLGATVVQLVPSRVDLCVDIYLGNTSFPNLFNAHRKTRCRKIATYTEHDTVTGLEVGQGGEVSLRIYDKSLEIEGDSQKQWVRHHWGLLHERKDNVWRIEFQLRRDALRKYGIQTVAILGERAGSVWADLTEHFFSLREKHSLCSTRWRMIPLWQRVHAAATDFGNVFSLSRGDVPATLPSVDYCIRNVVGCVISYAARRSISSAPQAIEALMKEAQTLLATKDFRYEVGRRLARLGECPGEADDGFNTVSSDGDR